MKFEICSINRLLRSLLAPRNIFCHEYFTMLITEKAWPISKTEKNQHFVY